MSKAYFNENDPYAAQWLRNLIAAGHIAPGDVDSRSIEDVKPGDLTGYTQCHFFAGIGVWSYALRRAGWADSRPVWTGSCPCQPFSAAGKGNGFSDERHLWPAWFHLISQCLPNVIFGEQVAAADGLGWLDLVQADLEAAGYARGAVDLCAAGVGAPHIRQRLWIFAELADWGLQPNGLANADSYSNGGTKRSGNSETRRVSSSDRSTIISTGEFGGTSQTVCERGSASPVNGYWSNADWLLCRDGKWRPVEARPLPLADGSADSLGRVRPEVIAKIEEEINASAMEAEIRRPEVLRALLKSLRAEAKCCWPTGGIPRLHEAPFLLAFMRQLSEQGWSVTKGKPLPRQQAPTGAPHQRELGGQQPGEPSDPVHFLSSLLARHTQEAWAHNYETYAEIGFPIGHGSPSRVGRLRAYGNAIVAQVAAEVIAAYMECRP